ncbi:MAG: reverse transcriptase domain-containing protein, partial [Patescibacteria group bacterium]
MAPERQDLAEPSTTIQLWELTKPMDPRYAAIYLELLQKTVAIPKIERFENPFLRPKKSGGARTIVPAAEPLRTIQYSLSRWIRNNLPQGKDYCYTGLGVKAALEAHRQNSYALVCDLKNAFDQVTAEKINHWFGFYKPELKGEPLSLMVDLLTFEDRAPQGCVSSAYAYNVVVSEMDHHLGIIAPQLGIDNWTRYSDNLCFSAKGEFDTKGLEAQVKRV